MGLQHQHAVRPREAAGVAALRRPHVVGAIGIGPARPPAERAAPEPGPARVAAGWVHLAWLALACSASGLAVSHRDGAFLVVPAGLAGHAARLRHDGAANRATAWRPGIDASVASSAVGDPRVPAGVAPTVAASIHAGIGPSVCAAVEALAPVELAGVRLRPAVRAEAPAGSPRARRLAELCTRPTGAGAFSARERHAALTSVLGWHGRGRARARNENEDKGGAAHRKDGAHFARRAQDRWPGGLA